MRGGNLLGVKRAVGVKRTVDVKRTMMVSLTGMILSLLFLLSVAADSISVPISVVTVDNQITLAEQAQFNLVVHNDNSITKTYTVYGLEVLWGIDAEQKVFVLNPGESRTIKVKVKPLGPFKPSTYSLKLFIDISGAGSDSPMERLTEDLNVILYPEEPLNYLPSFKVDIDMVERIDPREPVSVKMFLENGNPLDLSEMVVRIQSDIPEFEKEVSVNLKPLEKKTVEFSIIPNPYQQPRSYVLFFVFEKGEQQVKVVDKKIEIIEIVSDFTLEAAGEQVYLKKYWQLSITNKGNVLNTQEVKYPISWVGSFLTKAEGGDIHYLTEGSQRFAGWEVTLGPNETTSIRLVTNYRYLIYLLVLMLVIVGFYFYVRSPVSIWKSAVTTKMDNEGALSEIKIRLEIKNKSKKVLKDIEVADIVPGIANLERSLELGTLKPHHIKHTKKGTKVIWGLAELEPLEHRIITYKVKAKLNILGTLSLPRAVVEFGKGKKKKGKAYSNVFHLG